MLILVHLLQWGKDHTQFCPSYYAGILYREQLRDRPRLCTGVASPTKQQNTVGPAIRSNVFETGI